MRDGGYSAPNRSKIFKVSEEELKKGGKRLFQLKKLIPPKLLACYLELS